MSLRAALIATSLLGLAGVAEARSIPLERARDANVGVEIVSPGGYHQVTLILRNQGEEPVTVSALPGLVLDNRNQSEQDLTLSGPVNLSIGPGQTVNSTVGAYCIRPDRSSPTAGAHFEVGHFDNRLAQMLQGRTSAVADGTIQGQVWDFMRGQAVAPPPRPVEMTCVGPEGGLRVCVNTQATPVQGSVNIAPVTQPLTNIPIVQLPVAVQPPPPAAPVIRRQRPRHRPHAPLAPIGQPDPQVQQGLVIERD